MMGCREDEKEEEKVVTREFQGSRSSARDSWQKNCIIRSTSAIAERRHNLVGKPCTALVTAAIDLIAL
jgi:hypothetical protein